MLAGGAWRAAGSENARLVAAHEPVWVVPLENPYIAVAIDKPEEPSSTDDLGWKRPGQAARDAALLPLPRAGSSVCDLDGRSPREQSVSHRAIARSMGPEWRGRWLHALADVRVGYAAGGGHM